MQAVSAGSGLQNLGNTCFFNATLQSILHAPPFAALLQLQIHTSRCQKNKQWCIFCQVQKVYTGTRQARVFSPLNLVRNLNKVFKKFKLGRQEDSHQFLRYLIEGMQECELGKLPKEQREANQKKLRQTQIFEVFGGVVRTVVECLSCSHKSITHERYYDFNIECQRANSLHEGVNSYFAVDKLEGSNKYLCEHCKVRSNARKRFLLDTVPQVATFQLKRFTNSMRKIGKFIQYPLDFDLGKHLEKPEKAVLKLFAVIVHQGGSSFSGHYYAFVRVQNTWFKMDDSYVSKCSLETVLNQQAYILFYQKEEVFKKETKKSEPVKVIDTPKEKVLEKMIPEEKVEKNYVNGKKEEEKMVPQPEPLKLLLNEVGHKNGKEKSSRPKDKPKPEAVEDKKEENIQKEQFSEPIFADIESKLVSKLSQAQIFKKFEDENRTFSNTISKIVKEVILEVSPTKKKEPSITSQHHPIQEEEVSLPGLTRSKSKEDLERQMPYADLIIQTFDKILELKAKMPLKKPRNFSQRTIYNLRHFEGKMQKKRKIG